jgi:heterodisulfide reductase subunit A
MGSKAKDKKTGAALVIGGGIGGIEASLDLADSGIKVYLTDISHSIGGVMAQLDKTFPTNDCSMCIMAPKLVECGRHLNIDILTNSTITRIEGSAGNYRVTLTRHPRFIDEELCTGCGLCAEHCPVRAIDSYNEGLSLRSSVYIDYPQAVPLAYSIDPDICIGCRYCENVCLAKAIQYDDAEKEETIDVGAVVISTGFDEFDPEPLGEYGYKKYSNVLTSIEFERVLSASGPFGGHILRPSDGDIPEKIAFIQCVGSRNEKIGKGYCSSVCCMYATKEAVIAKEHLSNRLDCHIYFMDMRSYGRDFDRYYERAQNEYGIVYRRGMISSIEEDPETGNIVLRYEDEAGGLKGEEYDLVILSVGLSPSRGMKELSKTLEVDLNEYGFIKTDATSPVSTSREGIFVCGVSSEPKDIPETVTQASGVVSEVLGLLSDAKGTLTQEKHYPPERDVSGEKPRIGVFVCHCGINIGGVVNVPTVVEYARTLPDVVYAEENLYTCSQDTQEKIKEVITAQKLNRVVVASCTPRTHEPLFRETLREAGLNPYLFEMANIRDQCSWVHMNFPEEATIKSKDLVRMAVAKSRLIRPLSRNRFEIEKSALVIGGGLAGLTAAKGFANQGYDVHLVEKEKELGGNLKNLYYTLEEKDPQVFLHDLISEVKNSEKVTIYAPATVANVAGFVGNFSTAIVTEEGEEKEVKSGVIVVATGGHEEKVKEYCYGADSRIVSQKELEALIANEPEKIGELKTVVMIQCVGSRNEQRPYCSRVCCAGALKNAMKIRDIAPQASIYVLYRDLRSYGFKEKYFRKAREAGIIFVRYDLSDKPEVYLLHRDLKVIVRDLLLESNLHIMPDLVALSMPIVPNDNGDLAQMLKVPRTQDGFFLEAHVKLRPVDFATEGIFLCGLAHSPRFIDETISQADAAVGRASTILSKEYIESEGATAFVDETLCRACEKCVDNCQYSAIEIVQRDDGISVARVNTVLCKGCGACAVICPNGAMTARHYNINQISAMVESLVETG